jgi:RNA polymerase sigma factor (sigma-70 family)
METGQYSNQKTSVLEGKPEPVDTAAAREVTPADAGPFTHYLRELRSTPPLDREVECGRAVELRDAREGFARCISQLPDHCLEYLLEGDGQGPQRGWKWSLAAVESCVSRMQSYEELFEDPEVDAIFEQARDFKRKIDDARDTLILASLRFVPFVARHFTHHGIPFMDLVQEGNIGLLRAVERFDHERGYRFTTYAYWWIRQAISKAIVEKSRTIRLPESVRATLQRLRRVSYEMGEELGRHPASHEIAERMNLSSEKIDELLTIMLDPASLENFGSENDGVNTSGVFADSRTPSPLESALSREERAEVSTALAGLDPREQRILKLRFGIDRDACHTLEEIGGMMNLSRERVRQLEKRALSKIHETRSPGKRVRAGQRTLRQRQRRLARQRG